MFTIRTPKRLYYLAAETEDEMNRWVDCVCHVCGLKAFISEDVVIGAQILRGKPWNSRKCVLQNCQNGCPSRSTLGALHIYHIFFARHEASFHVAVWSASKKIYCCNFIILHLKKKKKWYRGWIESDEMSKNCHMNFVQLFKVNKTSYLQELPIFKIEDAARNADYVFLLIDIN